jgi:hypothetical protein
MNKSFGVSRAPLPVNRFTAQIELHDVAGRDKTGRHASREPKPILVRIVTRADVAIAVEHRLRIQDMIRGYQILNRFLVGMRKFDEF